jgi:monovalent cation:H+ antiporter-2, CPA2 family
MGWGVVLDVVVALGAALAAGLFAERVGLNSIVGYLLAGVLIGPTAFNLVQGRDEVAVISEIGVALLLFTIGLEFSWRQVRRLGGRLLWAAALSVVTTVVVVAGIALAFRLPMAAALSLGAVASLSSTAVVLRVLKERADLDAVYGKRATGILLVQDAMLVPLVLMVTFLAGTGGPLGQALGLAVVRTAVLVLVLVVFVSLLVPRLLDERLIARNRELPMLLAVATCVGAAWAAHELGVSPALGAFVAGALLADSKFADLMRADVMPLRTVFTTLFFVSIGLLADVRWIGASLHWIALATVAVLALKTLLTHLVLRLLVPGFVESLAAALAVSQIGEFSFVLAKVGHEGRVLSEPLFQGIVAVSLATLLVTPPLVGHAKPLARRIAVRLVPLRLLARRERDSEPVPRRHGHVLVVGYGEAGQAAARSLDEMGHDVVVVELNPTLYRRATECGYAAVLGDATSAELLAHARVQDSHGVVVTVPDLAVGRSVVAGSKSLAPHVPVAARARYHVHTEPLTLAGADSVADEEGDVGASLARTMHGLLPEAAVEAPSWKD